MNTKQLKSTIRRILNETPIDMGSGPKSFLKKKPNNWLTEKDEEEEEVEVDTEEDVEVDIDTEEEDVEVDTEVDVDVEGIGLSSTESKILDSLEIALNTADELGDTKLVTQIGNTITFFTRQYISKAQDLSENKKKNKLKISENLSQPELKKREDIIKNMIKNKRQLTKKYGKDAEKVMYGRATNLAKKSLKENKSKLREIIKKALMVPLKEQDPEAGVEHYEGEEKLSKTIGLLDRLEQALKDHDWHYQRSDDHRYWEQGSRERDEINNIMGQLEDFGFGEDAQALYDQFSPFTNEACKKKNRNRQ